MNNSSKFIFSNNKRQCSFLTKTINLESAGAVAVIVTDNDPTNEYLIEMVGDNTNREANIPAVFLNWKDGHMIKKSIESHELEAARINIPLNLTYTQKSKLKKAPWAYW